MKLLHMPAALAHWDVLLAKKKGIDALVLSFWEEERPLQGVAGLADWRLHGMLSRLIGKGYCSGVSQDSIMMPAGSRLPFTRIFLLGLGPQKQLTVPGYVMHVRRLRDVLSRAGAREYAVQGPGRSTDDIAARPALQAWVEEAAPEKGNPTEERVHWLEPEGIAKELGDLFS